MRATKSFAALTAAALIGASTAGAQTLVASAGTQPTDSTPITTDTTGTPAATAKKKALLQKQIVIQNYRPVDQRGINMFEAPKEAGAPWTGFKLDFGAAFTQQYQGLSHENTAILDPDGDGIAQNQLMAVGQGFNLASATSRSTTATPTSAAATTATLCTTRSSATTSSTPSRRRSAARCTSAPTASWGWSA